ncbi:MULTISPECIES: NADPH-dependent glutamate synthase [Methanoculleus]|uniref:Sulfide dehydrogenase (Flavoprotein) subunit SudA n=2 Tax=Methanoculleus TaxID=45989 RepID=A3CV12_METMJ|nr:MULTISPECIES: NADPH-dependent glutamate synthase [Methanoculleus]ABN57212.1 sulfide dehydrogenase (flavoprotein) subunit SudA [Methanoculleus marisnigri JR1]UYU18626.1 NADPH-dependent glutamate synthase [Methanoculleus submarinus]
MSDRPADVRIKDFGEVDCGLSAEEAVAEAERCLQCKKPFCVTGCPVNIDIPAFIGHVAEGNFPAAARALKEQNMLPAICGRVCPQETQCEGVCILGNKETPIRIGALERFVADRERENDPTLPDVAKPTGKRVAIVGSGPAGLTAAAELARAGHAVTIYESLHEAGGVLTYGIPAFRLPKDVVRAEIDQVLALGARLKKNHLVGRSVSVDELLAYDAVFLATGAGLPAFMCIPGENLSGVYSANEFLTRVNLMHAEAFPEFDTPVMHGARVAVIGGGNVAMDSARVARRLGAKVSLVYRRGEEEMPARRAEVLHAQEEGIEFYTCTNPTRILGEQCVAGIECVKMSLCGIDASGRRSPKPIEGSEFTLDVDMVVQAIGTSPNPLLVSLIPGLERGRKGNVVVDENGRTSIPHVYAGGDIATGAATVIEAMGSAKKAAAAIDAMLKGE